MAPVLRLRPNIYFQTCAKQRKLGISLGFATLCKETGAQKHATQK